MDLKLYLQWSSSSCLLYIVLTNIFCTFCSAFISVSTRAHNLFLFSGTGVISHLSSPQGFSVLVEMNVQLFALHFQLCCHQWKSHLSCFGLSFLFRENIGGQFFSTVVVMKMTAWVDLNWRGFVGYVHRGHFKGTRAVKDKPCIAIAWKKLGYSVTPQWSRTYLKVRHNVVIHNHFSPCFWPSKWNFWFWCRFSFKTSM